MFYFDFITYFKLLFLLFTKEPFHLKRGLYLFGVFILLSVFALFTFIYMLLDHVFFPGFRHVEIKTPIFIVGNGRSGTTHMHRLISGDTQQISFFKTYELLFPSVCQKKFVRALAFIDREYLAGRIEIWIKSKQENSLEEVSKMHRWDVDGAEEDDMLMMLNFSSVSLTFPFPYMKELDYLFRTDEKSPAARRRIMNYYKAVLKRQLYVNGSHYIHCCKSPQFTLKIRALKEAFPDAKFIYMVRHPYETIPSLIHLMSWYWENMGTPKDIALDSSKRLGYLQLVQYKYGARVIDELPSKDAYTVLFPQLLESPKSLIRDIYDRFGFSISAEYDKFLGNEDERAKGFTSHHEYDPASDLEQAHIIEELGDLFERYHWEC